LFVKGAVNVSPPEKGGDIPNESCFCVGVQHQCQGHTLKYRSHRRTLEHIEANADYKTLGLECSDLKVTYGGKGQGHEKDAIENLNDEVKGREGRKYSCSGTGMKNEWPWRANAQVMVAWARLARWH
jgi:hypothetical protein